MSIARLAQRIKTAGAHRMSLQLSQQIPGTPFAVRGGESKEERLPGMHRWVDRGMLERAMEAQAAGVPEGRFVTDEGSDGFAGRALTGAVLGGVAGHALAGGAADSPLTSLLAKGLPTGPLAATLLGALAGGGVGVLHHRMTAGRRREDAAEAYLGARMDAARNPRPMTALPQDRQDEGSAAAVPPKLLHTAPSVA